MTSADQPQGERQLICPNCDGDWHLAHNHGSALPHVPCTDDELHGPHEWDNTNVADAKPVWFWCEGVSLPAPLPSPVVEDTEARGYEAEALALAKHLVRHSLAPLTTTLAEHLAWLVLGSQWLADRDAQTAARALDEADAFMPAFIDGENFGGAIRAARRWLRERAEGVRRAAQ